MSAVDLIEFAKRNNIRFVQIGDNYPLHESDVAQLAKISNTAGIGIEAGARRLTDERLSEYITIAGQLQSPFLRMVIDDTDYHPSLQEVTRIINSFLPELKKRRLILAIENHDRFSSNTLVELINRTDPEWVGICLDTANSFGAVEGTYETVRLLAPYTVNLHIKDITIQRHDHKMGFTIEGTPAGSGLLNIPEIINTVNAYGKCRTVTLELWPAYTGDVADTIRREKQWVLESIHYLKSILT